MKNVLNLLCIFFIVSIFFDGGFGWSFFKAKSPIEVDKYTVVIIEETEKRQSLPPSQLNAINSQKWKTYVSERSGQWRVLDQHSDISKERPWVIDSFSLPRDSLPWLVFASSKNGYSGPFPENIDKLMEILNQ